ncbi:hypothetical protein [Parerythrobacter jejuensis]|uniref:Uncharacterized protein n=1 Tax=Parerythrobacter jejuensis TaxID=795812 RepID=A0A845AP57_9SPHN|nr:hypothetical protein [Parerythrobacter jejuensis]MXP30651.1 hypothetical protein [Parerythrobacter jejuensis]MXP33411.1 hypothetical protein [Parerythrobacter jejuensis]
MAFEVTPSGKPNAGDLKQEEGKDGWVYTTWRLTKVSRDKMIAAWPELDLPWVDLAAREFEVAWANKGSNREGFVGWRDDIESLSAASARLLKVLQSCAFPARHSLGTLERESGSASLYESSVELVEALVAETDRFKQLSSGMDARSLPHPMPGLIIKLARQLRYAGAPWDKKFGSQLTRLATITLDGLELRHSLDIRSSVKDTLKSGDQRLEKLR